jgi:ankyrin repeat protein
MICSQDFKGKSYHLPFQGPDSNTGLHYCAAMSNFECVLVLLEQYGINLIVWIEIIFFGS